jgi:hypothetical protein
MLVCAQHVQPAEQKLPGRHQRSESRASDDSVNAAAAAAAVVERTAGQGQSCYPRPTSTAQEGRVGGTAATEAADKKHGWWHETCSPVHQAAHGKVMFVPAGVAASIKPTADPKALQLLTRITAFGRRPSHSRLRNIRHGICSAAFICRYRQCYQSYRCSKGAHAVPASIHAAYCDAAKIANL